MSKWETVRLGDYIQEYSERNKDDSEIPVYSVTNSNGFCTEYFSKEVASKNKTTYKIVKNGYFAYNPSRINVGSVDWLREEETVIVSPLYNVFSVKSDLYQQYLYYYLKSPVGLYYIKELATGSVRDNLKLSTLAEFSISLPPFEIQKQITTNLDKVTYTINLCNQIIEKLDLLVKARFVEMFGDIKLNSMHYDTIQLDKIANVGSSKRVFVEELQESGIPFYRGTEVGALAEGKDIVPELFITEEHYKTLKEATGVPEIGDLLMPSICSDGRIWLVVTKEPFYFKDGRVLWIHPTTNNINSVYLLYFLKQKISVDYNNIASGTTFAELKIFALKGLQVFMPNKDLQEKFANFVEQTEKSKSAVKKVLKKAEILKKALMQEYFR